MAQLKKRHYQGIAETIRESAERETPSGRAVLEQFAYRLADYFQCDNAKFQREKFLDDAGFRMSQVGKEA